MDYEWEFPISPVAASRPRVPRYGASFAGPYKRFREACGEIIHDVLGSDFKPIEAPVKVDLELYITQPKRTKLERPKADIDNLVKAIFDAMNKRLWVDDVQVVTVYASKQWAPKGEDGYFTLGIETLGQ